MEQLSSEDYEAIRGILEAYRADGIENPLLPLDVDMDGDGIVDAFGLDTEGNVILVSGAPLIETVYVSDGEE